MSARGWPATGDGDAFFKWLDASDGTQAIAFYQIANISVTAITDQIGDLDYGGAAVRNMAARGGPGHGHRTGPEDQNWVWDNHQFEERPRPEREKNQINDGTSPTDRGPGQRRAPGQPEWDLGKPARGARAALWEEAMSTTLTGDWVSRH